MKVGEIEVVPLSDGIIKLPPEYFRNADWSVHKDLLNAEGNIDIPIGCFLVRTSDQTVLVDAGIGAIEVDSITGGQLPDQLAAAGTKPSDIDIVLCTHLHLDHMGWVTSKGVPFFPNATVRFGAADWDHFVTNGEPNDGVRKKMELLKDAGRISMIEGEGAIAPGINSMNAPGHTPGHLCVVISSGDDRVFLLGDAVTCPIQLQETEWEAMSDVDPKLARRTRESLWLELETSGDIAVAAHFPDLNFGRVLRGEGKRYFV